MAPFDVAHPRAFLCVSLCLVSRISTHVGSSWRFFAHDGVSRRVSTCRAPSPLVAAFLRHQIIPACLGACSALFLNQPFWVNLDVFSKKIRNGEERSGKILGYPDVALAVIEATYVRCCERWKTRKSCNLCRFSVMFSKAVTDRRTDGPS